MQRPGLIRPLIVLLTLVAGASLCALLSCADEYNPFADPDNAAIVVTGSPVHDGDTIPVFSTFSVSIDVSVKELVERITVSAPGNRLWTSADTSIDAAGFGTAPYSLDFSFADTGEHRIVLVTERVNGDTVADTLVLHLVSPLHQDTIAAILGAPVALRTPPVADRDVNYYWSLGGTAYASSQVCSLAVALAPARLSGTGALWVSDGRISSPADSFFFSFSDTSRPLIVCVNTGYVGRDTIYTSDTVFGFRVRITDRLDQWVDSASVDGLPFDRVEDRTYLKFFDRMHLHPGSDPLTLAVIALDHYHGGNEARDTFTVIFADTAARAVAAEILVTSPPSDSVVTGRGVFTVAGTVANRSLDSIDLSLSILGGAAQLPGQRITRDGGSWSWEVELDTGANAIRITATDNLTSAIVDQVDRMVRYVPALPDTAPPSILRILADGRDAANQYTDRATVALSVEVIDEASGVESLTVNGTPRTGGRWYYDTLALAHIAGGNEVTVRAVDSAGNDTVRSAVIFRNRLPVVESWPSPRLLEAGSPYADTVTAFDPDGDTLSFEKAGGPAGLSVSATGVLSWTPYAADTGSHTVTLRVWDGFQPAIRSYTLHVYPEGGVPPLPVAFATTTADFPGFLEAGIDTMRIVLRAAAGTGIRPLQYSASVLGRGTVLLPQGSDSVLTWAPAGGDTGAAQIIVVVRDAFPHFDTLYPRVLVVPPNRPCALTLNFGGDTLPNGAIDINARQGPDTLVVRISDPDNQAVEWYDLTIRQYRTQLVNRIDSATIDSLSIALDPGAFDGYDTITILVSDRAGHVDSLKQTVYYGMPPYAPQALSPVNAGTVNGSSTILSWQSSDPDVDSLWFDVYFGTNAQSLPLAGSTGSASYPVTGLQPSTTYYWRIVAHDWKGFTTGTVWEFHTQ